MNKKYIIEFTDINPDYEEDVDGNLKELFDYPVDFANDVKITDITDEIQDTEQIKKELLEEAIKELSKLDIPPIYISDINSKLMSLERQ